MGFWSAAFFLPKKVINLINSLSSSFLWHGSLGISTGAKVSWNNLAFPKSEDGLGIRSLTSWNQTCGLKLIWMLFFRGGSIWVAWMRHKYISKQSLWALNENNNSFCWTFRKILKLRTVATAFFSIKIGNGEDTYFWWDPWTPFGPLINHLGPGGPSSLGIPLTSLVSDRLSRVGWNLPPARSDLQANLFAYISSISYSDLSDKPSWNIDGKPFIAFNSKAVWEATRPTQPPATWAQLVWYKGMIPKHSTTVWLFVWNRNPTLDRLRSWGLDVEGTCLLCGDSEETRNHIYFECSYVNLIWASITQRLGFPQAPSSWDHVLAWLQIVDLNSSKSIALLQAWQAIIYEVWKERNSRYHDDYTIPNTCIITKILTLLKNKAQAMKNLGSKHGNAMVHYWYT